MTSMHVSLENEGATQNLGEDTFGFQNHGMIPIYSNDAIWNRSCSEWPLGLKRHRKSNLVTAVEVMPSTNEQACVRMVRNFD